MDLGKVFKDFLPGNKTYLAAAALVLIAALKYRVGDTMGAMTAFSQALGLIGLRAAIPDGTTPPPVAPPPVAPPPAAP